MNKLAILNLKGGIGKTTTAVSVAYILAQQFDRRVLLIDCDMQGNASKVFNRYDPDSPGTHNVMNGSRLIENCIFGTGYNAGGAPGFNGGNIDIVPANMYLMQANADVMTDTENEQLHRLEKACERLESSFRGAYDVVIFDCALGLDMTVLNAVIASDMVIAPVPFGGYEIDGLQQLTEQLDDLRAIKPDIRLKVLFTMKQGNKANREFEEWLKENSGYSVYNTPVRRSVTVQKATLEKKPLPAYSKRGTATKDYEDVTVELLEDLRTIESEKRGKEV
jgi:chromosome partitioning protein